MVLCICIVCYAFKYLHSNLYVHTGGKGWCPELVHHKSIARTWTKYQAKTHLVHCKFIQNVSSQFLWVRKWSVHSQCPRSCNQDVPIINIIRTFKIFPSGSFRISCSFPSSVIMVLPASKTQQTRTMDPKCFQVAVEI